MAPEFNEGAIVIIEPGNVVENGCYVVAEHDGEFLLRRLIIENEQWLLQALNDNYPTVEVSGPGSIKGRVIQRSGVRRKDRKRYL